jgi:predicted small integral membrane protein
MAGFDLSWMAWTLPSGLFFAGLAAVLMVMTLLAALRPEVPRRGILGIATTRGDRLFVSLVLAAWLHLFWLALVPGPLWGGSIASVLLAAVVFALV